MSNGEQQDKTSKDYYFDSYSHFGKYLNLIHINHDPFVLFDSYL